MKRAPITPQESVPSPANQLSKPQEDISKVRSHLGKSLRGISAAALLAMAACAPDPQKPNEPGVTPPVPVEVIPNPEVDTTPPDAPVIMTNDPIIVNADTAFVPVSVDQKETFRLQSAALNANGEVDEKDWKDVKDFTHGMLNVNAPVPAPSQAVFRAGDDVLPEPNWSERTASAAEVGKDIQGPNAPQLGQTSYLLPSTATSFTEQIIVASDARTLNVYRGTDKILTQNVSGGENLNLTVPHPAGESHTYAFETLDELGNSGVKAEAAVEAALPPDGTKAVMDFSSTPNDAFVGEIYPGNVDITNTTSYELRVVSVSGSGNVGIVTPNSGEAAVGELLNGSISFTWDTGWTRGAQPGDIHRIDLVVRNAAGEEKTIEGGEILLH